MRRHGWWIAGVLVLLTNLIVLAGVARNRSGEPEAVIELTERELPMVHERSEDTGVALRLQTGGLLQPQWLDRSGLEALGFDCSAPPNAAESDFHYRKQLPREGYVVLEHDGQSWQDWLATQDDEIALTEERIQRGEMAKTALQNRRALYERQRFSQSRLFPVGAGRDPEVLRERYPQRDRFLILPALFRISVERPWDDVNERSGAARLQGRIARLMVSRIHVSAGQASPLESLRRSRPRPVTAPSAGENPSQWGPRYTVTLKIGRRHEPWIEAISPIE